MRTGRPAPRAGRPPRPRRPPRRRPSGGGVGPAEALALGQHALPAAPQVPGTSTMAIQESPSGVSSTVAGPRVAIDQPAGAMKVAPRAVRCGLSAVSRSGAPAGSPPPECARPVRARLRWPAPASPGARGAPTVGRTPRERSGAPGRRAARSWRHHTPAAPANRRPPGTLGRMCGPVLNRSVRAGPPSRSACCLPSRWAAPWSSGGSACGAPTCHRGAGMQLSPALSRFSPTSRPSPRKAPCRCDPVRRRLQPRRRGRRWRRSGNSRAATGGRWRFARRWPARRSSSGSARGAMPCSRWAIPTPPPRRAAAHPPIPRHGGAGVAPPFSLECRTWVCRLLVLEPEEDTGRQTWVRASAERCLCGTDPAGRLRRRAPPEPRLAHARHAVGDRIDAPARRSPRQAGRRADRPQRRRHQRSVAPDPGRL